MKFHLVALSLTLVGSCASLSHKEKIDKIRSSIVFQDNKTISQYAKTITSEELKQHVYKFSSDEFRGRKSGDIGHNKASNYLKNYYLHENIDTPLGADNYFQNIPKSFFPEETNSTQNVIAYIKGSEKPDEVLIISGHSDHEGFTKTEIYNGADDNGSGTAAIMEIAEAFKMADKDGISPKRSIVFLHFTAEEMGLEGSRYYTQYPIFPLENTVANLNIDMIGRIDAKHSKNPNYIYIIGANRLSTELHHISEIANEEFTNLELDYTFNRTEDKNRYYYRSDHYNFAKKGIPVIFYFNGEHEDYHKPTDTADKINYRLLENRTKLIFATAWYLVNSEDRILVDKHN